MKYSCETVQYLPYFWNTKIRCFFSVGGNMVLNREEVLYIGITLIFKRKIAYCDLFLTFRGLGSEGWIKVECLVRYHCRFKGRILLLLSKVFPVDGGEKAVIENILNAIRTWKYNQLLLFYFFFHSRNNIDIVEK